jgi:hypothetical protein
MSNRNNGFRKIMMNQFLRKCEASGIDPQTIDLAKYDFETFNSVNDLVQHYASLGDPICIKILNAEYKFVDDYVNYLESKLQEYNSEAEEEELRGKEDLDLEERMKKLEKALEEMKVDIDKICISLSNLENKIINRTEWLNGKFEKRHEELAREVEQIKKEKNAIVTKAIEDVKRDVKNEIDRIWEYKVKGLQTYLEDFITEKMKTVVIEKPSSQETREETKALKERLRALEDSIRNMDPDKLMEGRLKGLEEMITYAIQKNVEYTEELKRSYEELKERYLDLVNRYQSLLGFIENASANRSKITNKPMSNSLEDRLNELEEMGLIRSSPSPKPKIKSNVNWKKIGFQVLKGVYLGLICVPLIPFLPLLYGQAYAKAGRKEKQSLLAYLGL